MILTLTLGLLLTVVIINQVGVIDKNTILLKKELIPALEKSTDNKALLKKISENLTFALLTEEEDMVLEIRENKMIERNLQNIFIAKESIQILRDKCLKSFQCYFKIATHYTLKNIQNPSDATDSNRETEELFKQFNRVEKNFLKLKYQLEEEIAFKIDFIESVSTKLIYFVSIYMTLFSAILFYISYLIYRDFNARFTQITKSLDRLGIQKTLLEDDDALGILSKNIDLTIQDYTIIDAQRKELTLINKNIQESMEYASLMQQAILPLESTLQHYSYDSFVFWKPKDTVGGDIYFLSELENREEILIMVIDGVGHGVSGAFLTILVKAIETQIIAHINSGKLEASPAKILEYFNRTIKIMLNQRRGSKSNTGFDGGILYYNSRTNKCTYAGAKTALYIVDDDKLEILKSDRANVGFIRTKLNQTYTQYDVTIKKGTKLYITTDGIIDQEGEENRRYGKKQFEHLILKHSNKPFKEQKKLIEESFIHFKKQYNQSDDITVLGVQFK